MIFIRFLKGSDSKIKNHCSRVSSPVNISGAIPETGKRDTYLSSPPSTGICLFTSLLKLETEMGVHFENSRQRVPFYNSKIKLTVMSTQRGFP